MRLQNIKASNFLGLTAVNMDIDGVTLVAGLNGAGKSSIAEAVAIALTGNPRRVTLKKDFNQLIKNGAKSGSASVVCSDELAEIVLPSGDRQGQDGSPWLPLLLDASLFPSMSVAEKRTALFRLAGLKAGPEEIAGRMAARGCDEALIEQIKPYLKGGFAAAHLEAQTKLREVKAVWKNITGGEVYGEKKAETWAAPEPSAPALIDALVVEEILETEKAILDKTKKLGALGVSTIDPQERQATLELADEIPAITEALETNNLALLDMEDRLAKMPDPGPQKGLECPACGIVLKLSNGSLQPFEKAEEGYIERRNALIASQKQLKSERAALEKRLEGAVVARNRLEKESAITDKTARERDSLQKELDILTTNLQRLKGEKDAADVLARAATQAKETTEKAAKAHAEAKAWAAIADALSPNGIPGEMLAGALKPINDRLRTAAATTGWAQVSIGADMSITAGGRLYGLLSESEQWRANAMLAEAISFLSGLKFILLDRADVLDIAGRGTLMSWLQNCVSQGSLETAIVFMTLKAPPQMPGAYWVENGEVARVDEPVAVAA